MKINATIFSVKYRLRNSIIVKCDSDISVIEAVKSSRYFGRCHNTTKWKYINRLGQYLWWEIVDIHFLIRIRHETTSQKYKYSGESVFVLPPHILFLGDNKDWTSTLDLEGTEVGKTHTLTISRSILQSKSCVTMLCTFDIKSICMYTFKSSL